MEKGGKTVVPTEQPNKISLQTSQTLIKRILGAA
jgi:hypothetical protein